MEPLKINVNVEIGLKQTTIDTLRLFFGPQITTAGPCLGALEEDPQPEKPSDPTPEPKKPKTVGADPEGTGAEPYPVPLPPLDYDDLPPSNAELAEMAAAAAVPTEAEMRAAIQATRKRGVAAKTIRQYIHDTFGVETSVECPENRRQELIDGLANLAA